MRRIIFIVTLFFVACSGENDTKQQNRKEQKPLPISGPKHLSWTECGSHYQALLDFYTHNTIHTIITDDAGNVIKNEGCYFTIRSGVNEKEEILIQVYSIDYPNKEKNLALFGHFENGGDVHLGQWFMDSTYYQKIYSIPDSLNNKIKELELCIVYYDPETMSQDIIECQYLELEN